MVQRTNTPRNTKQRTTKRYEASTLCYKDYLGNPVFNHKVEQVLRALIGHEEILKTEGELYNPSAVGYNLTCDLRVSDPESHIVIGIADHRGYRFTPTTNSLLISLGYNPNVLLYTLCCAKDTQGIHKTLGTTEGKLVTSPEALMLCAYDSVFNYKEAYKFYQEYRLNHKDKIHNVLAL